MRWNEALEWQLHVWKRHRGNCCPGREKSRRRGSVRTPNFIIPEQSNQNNPFLPNQALHKPTSLPLPYCSAFQHLNLRFACPSSLTSSDARNCEEKLHCPSTFVAVSSVRKLKTGIGFDPFHLPQACSRRGVWKCRAREEERGSDPPELTLDLYPARAAQEWPGVEPFLHCLQARAQHLQPQVQHLLTAKQATGRVTSTTESQNQKLHAHTTGKCAK